MVDAASADEDSRTPIKRSRPKKNNQMPASGLPIQNDQAYQAYPITALHSESGQTSDANDNYLPDSLYAPADRDCMEVPIAIDPGLTMPAPGISQTLSVENAVPERQHSEQQNDQITSGQMQTSALERLPPRIRDYCLNNGITSEVKLREEIERRTSNHGAKRKHIETSEDVKMQLRQHESFEGIDQKASGILQSVISKLIPGPWTGARASIEQPMDQRGRTQSLPAETAGGIGARGTPAGAGRWNRDRKSPSVSDRLRKLSSNVRS